MVTLNKFVIASSPRDVAIQKLLIFAGLLDCFAVLAMTEMDLFSTSQYSWLI